MYESIHCSLGVLQRIDRLTEQPRAANESEIQPQTIGSGTKVAMCCALVYILEYDCMYVATQEPTEPGHCAV